MRTTLITNLSLLQLMQLHVQCVREGVLGRVRERTHPAASHTRTRTLSRRCEARVPDALAARNRTTGVTGAHETSFIQLSKYVDKFRSRLMSLAPPRVGRGETDE